MARTTLTPTQLSSAGAAVSTSAANADGHALSNDGRVFLYVKNTNGASGGATVTLQATHSHDGLDLPNKDIAVAANEEYLIGPFDRGVYNRATGEDDAGMVYVDFTTAADLVVQAFRLR